MSPDKSPPDPVPHSAGRPAWAGEPGDRPVVRTRAGLLRGRIMHADQPEGVLAKVRPVNPPRSDVIATWRGVHYGASTAGAGRFRTPAPVQPWEGVRDALNFRPPAAQPNSQISSMAALATLGEKIIGTEDCLHLDIVRPATEEVLPVVVYFHGGSFVSGASHQRVLRGHRLAPAIDVVYVAINFRLGVMGYLDVHARENDEGGLVDFDVDSSEGSRAHDADGLNRRETANPAIADQIQALRWVHANIAAFGGDPGNVTLMGESAGANAVITLMAAPLAHHLFHKAIAQSPPIASVHTEVQARMWGKQLREQLGLRPQATVDELRELPMADLVRAGQSMSRQAKEARYLNSCYSPMVDGDLLPEHPLDAFANGRQAKVPLIIGTNKDEASFSKFIYQRESKRSAVADKVTRIFDPAAAPKVLAAYDGAGSREDFAAFFGDAVFWAPAIQVAENHSAVAKTWMYRFVFAPAALRWLGLGAVHSLDLAVMFGDPDSHRVTAAAKFGGMPGFNRVVETMQRAWSNFCHHGVPGADWPVYRVDDRVDGDGQGARGTMLFDKDSRVVNDHKRTQRVAWMDYNLTRWGTGRPELLSELGFELAGFEILDDPTDDSQR
ncbi:carboxylesterase/lipase family protein [Corynebacterium guangdongense]|uniref:Carboxylic ester hydrolase n=1 Tax=Corynebacterium guangdongense TaxID=1783348 RepID=A0ABU1ZW19_9CORY|nr:carboxylesterase/lipase family protein [Corynebacterium guangdongense]MDR7329050.1 para-nitrobenzyl esterase [Corynebacterium guangdongense]